MRSRIFTQWTHIQTAIALARILLGKISARRRPGTGPAPKANDRTNLQKNVEFTNSIKKKIV